MNINSIIFKIKQFGASFTERINEINGRIKSEKAKIGNNGSNIYYQSNNYVQTKKSLTENISVVIKMANIIYEETQESVSTIGSKIIATIPFIFLYQFAINNIRIKEKLIILLLLCVAAILNMTVTGFAFFPIAILLFCSIWEKNIVIASLVLILLMLISQYLAREKKSKFIYPIFIMYITCYVSGYPEYLILIIIFTCSLMWVDGAYIFTAPFLLIVNSLMKKQIFTVITLSELPSVDLQLVELREYFKNAVEYSVTFERSMNDLISLFSSNFVIYISMFLGLYFIAKVFKVIMKKKKLNNNKLSYTLFSHLYAAIGFWVVLFITNIIFSAQFTIMQLEKSGVEIRVFDSFENLISILPQVSQNIVNNNLFLVKTTDIIIAFLLSIPFSVFIDGYEFYRNEKKFNKKS